MKPRVLALLPGLLLAGSAILAQQPDRIGSEFRVNSHVLKNQIRPRIAHQADGGFIVVWEGGYDDPVRDDEKGIWGQRFDEDLLFASGLEFGDLSGWSAVIP